MQSSEKEQGEIGKLFLSEQCNKIEENSLMGRTRNLLNKIRGTKGACQGKMGTIKDRNGMDLTGSEDI